MYDASGCKEDNECTCGNHHNNNNAVPMLFVVAEQPMKRQKRQKVIGSSGAKYFNMICPRSSRHTP